jgi:hypothetical protein
MTFLSNNWRGLAVFALGAATVLAAVFLLHSCADEGHFMTMGNGMQANMGCTWTERAVIGTGGLVAVIGLIMMVMRQSARALSLVAAAAGLLMIGTPLWLIPTCVNPMMACNLSLKPGTLLLGGLTAIVGLVGALKLQRAGASGTEGKVA